VSEETATLRELAKAVEIHADDQFGREDSKAVMLYEAAAALRSSAERVEELQSQLSEATKPVTDEAVADWVRWCSTHNQPALASLLERMAREKDALLQQIEGEAVAYDSMRHQKEAAERRCQAYEQALRALVLQVEISGAVDEHGHRLTNLKAMADARAALTGKPK
jgi:hypothetical protein